MDGFTKCIIDIKKNGPSQTLNVNIPSEKRNMDVDLVACLKFSLLKPPPGFNCSNGSWLAIPKSLPGVYEGNLLWHACFYEQEKELLSSKVHMKTAFRLLKKLRDTQKLSSLSSYYIETVFLHEIKSQDASFWELNSLTYLFMHMLIKLQKAAKDHRIPFDWCNGINLLEKISNKTMEVIAARLNNIVNKINSMIECDPLIIARFILNERELGELRTNYDYL